MLRLGLTGSIASGKSTVGRMLVKLGVPVIAADDAVHELYRGAAVGPIEALFPGTTHDGEVDRTALSRTLLEAPGRLKALEAIVHPMVRARIRAFLDAAERDGASLAVADIPLLFETGADYGLDKVLVVIAPEAAIRERALARPGMSVEKLEAILARQLPQAEKQQRADYVIDTGTSLDETRRQVADLVGRLRQES
jgi:dephospho-CoA kinase